jgi:hypothetical protein
MGRAISHSRVMGERTHPPCSPMSHRSGTWPKKAFEVGARPAGHDGGGDAGGDGQPGDEVDHARSGHRRRAGGGRRDEACRRSRGG